jgi:hypothetical protein
MLRRLLSAREGQQRPNDWFLLMLVVLVPLYWLFARYLERIDMSPVLEPYWQSLVPFFPLPGIVTFLVELFHPRVLRHLAAIVLGWFLARNAAVTLVQILYDLPDRSGAEGFLDRLRSPKAALGTPVAINGKTLEADRDSSALLRVGGPGLVLISAREVGATEMNGRFYRVIGPGVSKLGQMEYLYAALDLRQQERRANDVPFMTKDGIEIRTDIAITYRISTGGEPPTRAKPYPYDEEAVRLAAYAETVDADLQVTTWETIPLNTAQSTLARIVAKYQLDQLLYPDGSANDPNLTIRNELERRVRNSLEAVGIELTGIHIGRLELPESVVDQYIEYWQAHWETQGMLKAADGEAFTLEEVEVARAEAEVTMIRAIAEGLQRARLEGNADTIHEVVALRLIEAMEKVAEQSQHAAPLPANLMPQLTDLRETLLLNE